MKFYVVSLSPIMKLTTPCLILASESKTNTVETSGSSAADVNSSPIAQAIPAAKTIPSVISSSESMPLKTDNETSALKASEAVTKEQTSPDLNEQSTQDEKPPPIETKPVVPVSAAAIASVTEAAKKPEITKVDAENTEKDKAAEDPNTIDLQKSDDPMDNPDENDPFGMADVSETPEKDDGKNIEQVYQEDGEDGDDYGDDAMVRNNNHIPEVKIPQDPVKQVEPIVEDGVQHKKIEYVEFEEDPDSNFFTYLCVLMFLCVLLYILYQNRHKILALFLEGRRGGRRSRERSKGGSKAAYSKLDCNLEEAIMSKKSLSGKSMDIIY